MPSNSLPKLNLGNEMSSEDYFAFIVKQAIQMIRLHRVNGALDLLECGLHAYNTSRANQIEQPELEIKPPTEPTA